MKCWKSSTLALFALSALGTAALAQSATLVAKDGSFKEKYGEAATVSGSPLVGVQPLVGADKAGGLFGVVPKSWAGQPACVKLVSDDGRYESQIEYDVPAEWIGRELELPFPTEKPDVINSYSPDRLGVILQMGTCTDITDEPVVSLSAWNLDKFDGKNGLKLFVNSLRADETYLLFDDDDTEVPCHRAEDGQLTGFDAICTIEGDRLGDEDTVRFELNRLKSGNRLPSLYVTLALVGS